MSGTQDPLTTALTGQLPFVLLMAAGLARPVSFFLLWLYRRAVLRSMRARGGRTGVTSSYVILAPSSSFFRRGGLGSHLHMSVWVPSPLFFVMASSFPLVLEAIR